MDSATIRQVWMRRRGDPRVLEVREVPAPAPGPGQVRLRVAWAGVNFADVMMRRGLYPDAPRLPAVAGYEVSGTIDAVGPGADPALVGRPAVAMCNFGGYSEAVCVSAAQAWPLPAGADLRAAAALPVNYLTAWQMVRVMAPVAPGGTVLVQSAAGGVGQAVVQLCALAGVRVIGSASPAKHEELRAQGLAFVFDSGLRKYAEAVRAPSSHMRPRLTPPSDRLSFIRRMGLIASHGTCASVRRAENVPERRPAAAPANPNSTRWPQRDRHR